jgi:hypothetical protein
MSAILSATTPSNPKSPAIGTMKALIFRGVNNIGIEQVPIPTPGPGEAVIRVTLTTICGTDLHIVRGEYPVRAGLIIGHEPVGVIHELGVGVTGYNIGDRVLVGAIMPAVSATTACEAIYRNAAAPSASAPPQARSSREPASSSASNPIRSGQAWPERWARTWSSTISNRTPYPKSNAPHRRKRRGRGHRSPRHAGYFRERPARVAPRRNAVEPTRLFRKVKYPARSFRSGPRRLQNRHHALPRRKRTHEAPHGTRAQRQTGSRPAAYSHLYARPDRRSLSTLRQSPRWCN